MADLALRIESISRLQDIAAVDWDALNCDNNPFLSHDFLAGLERHDCLAAHGWQPRHLVARQGGKLLAAMPLYQRDNSFGEFVFDWDWADAHERTIGPYYPKLVSAVPFTPVSGPRLLLHPQAQQSDELRRGLLQHALHLADNEALSSLHVLFPDARDSEIFEEEGLQLRTSFQYHWSNRGYLDFEDFLSRLTSKRRKEIRRERRSIHDSPLRIEVLSGAEINVQHWKIFHEFYRATFERKWGIPRLTREFFQSLTHSRNCKPVLFLACLGGQYVAGAFAVLGNNTLYGRHWGCRRGYRNLHFELCYYQTIDYCIRHGLNHLDVGVQGEHKLSRGFVATATRSYHWLRDSRFRQAVTDFLARERPLIDAYIGDLAQHRAYKGGEDS